MNAPENKEALIAEFVERSGQDRYCAMRCLMDNNWDVEAALIQCDNEEE